MCLCMRLCNQTSAYMFDPGIRYEQSHGDCRLVSACSQTRYAGNRCSLILSREVECMCTCLQFSHLHISTLILS